MSTATESPEAIEVGEALNPRCMLEGLGPDTRVVVANVAWDVYERIVDSVREGENFRIAYDGKDIEMMSIGVYHDSVKSRMDAFIGIVAGELSVDHEAIGSATWKRKNVERGIEPDLSYYFEAVKLAIYAAGIARQSNSADDYPNPDLAVEIDISEPRIDRPDIYRKLQLPEVWRAYQGSVSIERLGPSGTYIQAQRSRFLPVRPEDVTRFIFGEESRDKKLVWERRLREWIRTVVVDAVP